MRKEHVILYVPGLGDHRLTAQNNILRLWRVHRVLHEVCAVRWLENDAWAVKLDRLVKRIDHHSSQGRTVSLVGISAGGAAVMAALGERPHSVHAVILVCAKSQYPDKLGQSYTQKHPSLKDAVVNSSRVIADLSRNQKSRILNMHPIADEIVPVSETKIPGVTDYQMPIFSHFGGIGYAITFGSFKIVRFIKSLSS